MIANIKQGNSFSALINYVLKEKKDAKVLSIDGLRTLNKQSLIDSFNTQALLKPSLSKPVGHISLSFSPEDRDWLTDALMLKIAKEYMDKMNIKNTQSLIVKHNDTLHPHLHLVYNRIAENGKTISDKQERMRSLKVCEDLSAKYELRGIQGKQNVNRERLKEPDATKYHIYDTLKMVVDVCNSWEELKEELAKEGITTSFTYRGNTKDIQGVCFEANGYCFNGSKIDRDFSYTKIDAMLNSHNWEYSILEYNMLDNKQDYDLEEGFSIGSSLVSIILSASTGNDNDSENQEEEQPKRKRRR